MLLRGKLFRAGIGEGGYRSCLDVGIKKGGCLNIEIKSPGIEYPDLFPARYPNKERVKSHCDTPSSLKMILN